MAVGPFTAGFGFKTDSDSAAMAGSKSIAIFYIFLLKGYDGGRHTTAGFGFKTGSDSFYHSRLLKPTQKAPFTIGF